MCVCVCVCVCVCARMYVCTYVCLHVVVYAMPPVQGMMKLLQCACSKSVSLTSGEVGQHD